MTTGFLLGKFLPPHRGHQYLIDFARGWCDRLVVLVCSTSTEPIDGALRFAWMREGFPACDVMHLHEDLPQAPDEYPGFWPLWQKAIRRFVPEGEGPDLVFASETYGFRLAEVLGARYIPCDHARELVPVSATMIREDPMRHWEWLLPAARPHFVKRVCIFGPESTGKSTLARDLARHFNTVHVAEYARPLLDFKIGQCDAGDIDLIARGQAASEDALARQANRVLFTDTDNATTAVWSRVLFGDCPAWIEEQARARRYDLTLLTDIDVPWVDDSQRTHGHFREEFMALCRAKLDELGRPHVLIRGAWEERLRQAVAAVEEVVR